tara:strand:+ start:1365 stop:2042 length:678 start_codon:yes stop_codon:yes gene_type:complete
MLRKYSHFFEDGIEVFLTENQDSWSDDIDSRRTEILNYSKKNKLIMPRQVHGDKVMVISEICDDVECDAIIYNRSLDIAGAINVADCVPICMYDCVSGYIALIHSGWRGTLKMIAVKTLSEMLRLGSSARSIKVFVGPSIRGCCYEVEDFFASKFYKSSTIEKSNKFYVDIVTQILQDLEREFVPRENIFIDDTCTYEDLKLHSYRRDSDKSGRMSLVAYMRSNG